MSAPLDDDPCFRLPLTFRSVSLSVSVDLPGRQNPHSDEVDTGEKSTRFTVNFSPKLREIINETKYMEHLGFPVPEIARNVALQEDKLLR